MGQQQTKDELLYQQVNYGNTDGIKALCSHGAGLEWIDREGKTPLIVACLNPELYNVAKTLIELGANVNAYRPGRNAGTPLHDAAKKGLESIVNLLLSHGANPLVMNDDCQTPLDLARAKRHCNVVRAIEKLTPVIVATPAVGLLFCHVVLMILNRLSNWSSQRMLLLRIPDHVQFFHFGKIIWRSQISSMLVLQCQLLIPTKPASNLHLQMKVTGNNYSGFVTLCKGIPQAMHPAFLQHSFNPVVQATAPAAEDVEQGTAINASIQTASAKPPSFDARSGTEASASTSCYSSANSQQTHDIVSPSDVTKASKTTINLEHATALTPYLGDKTIEDGPIHYPPIDSSIGDSSSPTVEKLSSSAVERKEDAGSLSSCDMFGCSS